jgi:hypothetical protein
VNGKAANLSLPGFTAQAGSPASHQSILFAERSTPRSTHEAWAAPEWRAADAEFSGPIADYICRSTIMRLISAMAFAGLRLFGQALAQFMMVWQR